MNESNISDEVYREFHQISRKLTYMTVALVCAAALIVWLLSIDISGKRTSLLGVMFMGLAFFTYKIPHISYRFMQGKYKGTTAKRNILGYDWKQFRDQAMQRRY